MAQLTIEIRARGPEASVDLGGEIDLATVGDLRDRLAELIDGGAEGITLHCSKLEFLDSAGVGVLLAASNRLARPDALLVADPPPQVRRVLELTGAARHLSVRP